MKNLSQVAYLINIIGAHINLLEVQKRFSGFVFILVTMNCLHTIVTQYF